MSPTDDTAYMTRLPNLIIAFALLTGCLASHDEFKSATSERPSQVSTQKSNTSKSESPHRFAADLFVSTALSFRTRSALYFKSEAENLGLAGAGMFSTDPMYKEIQPLISALFFRDSIVRVSGINSPAPIAFYYHPLMDVIVVTKWELRDNRRYELVEIVAVPGEFTEGRNMVDPRPRWLTSQQRPYMEELKRTAPARLAKLANQFPLQDLSSSARQIIDSQNLKPLKDVAQRRMLLHLIQMRPANLEPLNHSLQNFLQTLHSGDRQRLTEMGGTIAEDNVSSTLLNMSSQTRKQLELSGLYLSADAALALFSLPQDGCVYLRTIFQRHESNQYLLKQMSILDVCAVQ